MRLHEKWIEDSRQMGLLAVKEQLQAVIYGLAIGDALGVPVEFKERGTYNITDMIGHGTYNQPLGTWSDDTSLSLALMEHLSECSDLPALMDKFVAYRNGYLTPYGDCFDIGIGTNQAIERYLSGVFPEEAGGQSEMDNGNGALMRLSPLAILLQEEFDFPKKVKIIERYTKITHRHPRTVVASILYIQILIGLLLNNNLENTIKGTKKIFLESFDQSHPYRKEFEEYYADLFNKEFLELPSSEIASTGYVVDTLKAVIWCVGTTDSFKSAILKAVNLGGDTDTIGAITGTLAGALYKIDSIPEEWINNIANKLLIDKKIRDFLHYFEELEYQKKGLKAHFRNRIR
ncbi:TPA: ADP-ribosylglycohydrolase family protein [Streptococcus suis]|uniref:ADP-ribosylglycohydrolase family protein n=1 Tax=unclassified Streptococcus TaxID=2608887 RepID=UPI003709243A